MLREAKNVKYGSFMIPGRRMDVAVDLVKHDDGWATFKGKGTDDGPAVGFLSFYLSTAVGLPFLSLGYRF